MPTPAAGTTNANAGKVEFTSYAPKDIGFKTDAAAPSVLLLNDKFDPDWHVLVDGQPEPLLRCNFFMRGVYLKPGQHTVKFEFRPPMRNFYISLFAVCLGMLLVGVLVLGNLKPPEESAAAPEHKKGNEAQKEVKLTKV